MDRFWILFIALALTVLPVGFGYLYFFNPIWDPDRPVDEGDLVWMPQRHDSGQAADTEYSRARERALGLKTDFLNQDYARVEAVIDAARRAGYTPWRLGSWQAHYFKYLMDVTGESDVDIDIPRARHWVEQSPKSTYAHTYLGHLYANLGWSARGGDYRSETPEQNFQRMRRYFKLAIKSFERALQVDPANVFASRELVNMARTGRLGIDIDQVFQRAIGRNSDYYYLYKSYLTGLVPRWGGSVEKMFAFARRHGGEDRQHASLARLIGQVHLYQARNLATRESRLNKQADDSSYNKDIYWTEYYRYFKDDDVWEEYSNAFAVVFDAHPLNADALHEFANVAWGSGRKQTAFIYYEKALQADPVFLGANRAYRFAERLRAANLDDEANRYYRMYLDLSPDHVNPKKAYAAADYVGWQYAMKGKYRESFPYYKIVAELTPDNARSLSNYCNAFYNVHRYEEGIEYCNQAIDIDPEHAWSYHILAEIYQRTGDRERSRENREKYNRLTQ